MLLRAVALLCPFLLAAHQPDTLPDARITAVRTIAAVPPSDTVGAVRLGQTGGIADALREFTGLQVKDYSGVGGLKTVNVRSLGSQHVGVYIDGIQVDQAQNMQVDLGRFSTDNLRGVELYNGQRSAPLQTAKEYGTAAAVYLTTAPPERDALRFRLRGGAFGTVSPSVQADKRWHSGLSAIFNAEGVYTTGRYPFHNNDFGYDTVMVRDNGDLRSVRAEALLFGKDARQDWSVHLYGYGSERGLPGAVVRRPSVFPLGKDRQADRNFFAQARWQRALTEGYDIAVRAKVSSDFLHYRTRPEIDPQAIPADNSFTQRGAYLSVSQLFAFHPGWQAHLATDLQYSTLDADLYNFVFPRRLTGYAAAAVSYGQERIRLNASLLYTVARDRFRQEEAGGFSVTGQTRSALSPALLARFDVSEHLQLSGFAKRSYRMPSFNDLYYTLIGNSRLRPEDAWQFNLAAAWNRPAGGWNLSLRGEAYRNFVTDKIIAVPTSSAFRWSMYNVGRADIRGTEWKLGLRRGGAADCGLLVKYTFQHAIDKTDPALPSYGNQIAYIPRHSGSVGADLSWKDWRIDVSAIWSGVRYSNNSTYPDYRIDPYLTCDLRLMRNFRLGTHTLTGRIRFNNVFNRQYEVVQGYPMPGFHILADLEFIL